MSAARPQRSWSGWGDAATAPEPLAEDAEGYLRERLGIDGTLRPPVALDDVELPPSRLSAEVVERLGAVTGARGVARDRVARVTHAAGRSYLDLVRLRRGDASGAPDAVVLPRDEREVAEVLRICDGGGIALVPFGGGTSVVGGVDARGARPTIALDLAGLDEVVTVDRVSRLATAQAGIRGPAFERALNAHGLTFGHFPQSYEGATLGGYVATRSAGQASTGYGRVDELLRGVRLVAPAGTLVVAPHPATAAGPSLLQLVAGSEGALGVVTEATVEVRAMPAVRRYEAWSVGSFVTGCELLRALAQPGLAPDVLRLSDSDETEVSLALAGGGAAARLMRRYLDLRGQPRPCLLVTGWEGTAGEVRARRAACLAVLRRHGAVSLGTRGGAAWEHGRFRAPYLRDRLLDRGVLVETLESAATWSLLGAVHTAVGAALRDALSGDAPLVGCHVSHVYATGASLYWTVLARQRSGDEEAQWLAAKRAATGALLDAGGTLTHHHAVGRDHAPWLPRELGALGVDVLRAVRRRLDPNGIMNPGVLTGEEAAATAPRR